MKLDVDGTDLAIEEPERLINPRWWFSHKLNRAAVRYEVAIAIHTGWIVWVNGPYACGRNSDLRIARDKIIHLLRLGEKIVADGGYRDGGDFMETPTGLNNPDQRMKKVARARHETVNCSLQKV